MNHKSEENLSFEVLDVLFRGDENFSCSWNPLNVLYQKKIRKKTSAVIFLSIFGHQNPGSGSGSALTKNAGSVSGSALKPMRSRNTDSNEMC
jgi:hypothetical protein